MMMRECVSAFSRRLYSTLTVEFPLPAWGPGMNTLARNLLAAIPHVMHDKVLFFEDDDWYAEDYCVKMASHLMGSVAVVGDPVSCYYNVQTRSFRTMHNYGMASLCQTGMKSEHLSVLEKVCRASGNQIDVRLWKSAPSRMLLHIGLVTGIKGLPGRPGIGIGHKPERSLELWKSDSDLLKLREWIGDDVELYEEFLSGPTKSGSLSTPSVVT